MLFSPRDQGVQAACRYVLRDLTIPGVGPVLLDPLHQFVELARRQFGDGASDVLNAHAMIVPIQGLPGPRITGRPSGGLWRGR